MYSNKQTLTMLDLNLPSRLIMLSQVNRLVAIISKKTQRIGDVVFVELLYFWAMIVFIDGLS
ncbi:MAG: hypothetical protein ABGX33_06175 [Cycloclasticus sp.]